jgi:sugar/nucleoside kinase (ribokinase family)
VTTGPESLLVVGSIAFDDLDLPSGEYRDVLGGSATYSSLTASIVAPGGVRVVGIVGSDFPDEHLAELRQRGVDTGGVERAAGRTFRWHGRYSSDLASRTTLDTQLNVFAQFSPVIPAAYRTSPFVLLGNIHPKLQVSVLEQVRRPKLVAADTMNFWIEREPASVAEMLQRVDLLIINDEEARQLSGIHNLVKAAADIRKRGPKMLVIKRGEFGALLFDAGRVLRPRLSARKRSRPDGRRRFVRRGTHGLSGIVAWGVVAIGVAQGHALRIGAGELLRRGRGPRLLACHWPTRSRRAHGVLRPPRRLRWRRVAASRLGRPSAGSQPRFLTDVERSPA